MTYNINNPEAVVNIESAHTVNITQAKAVNLGGFVGVGERFVPSDWHEEECKQWITSRDIPENAPCICPEVRQAYLRGIRGKHKHDYDSYKRGREDAAKAVEAAPYMTNVVPSGWTDETWRGYRPDAIDRDIAIAAARGDGEQA